MRKEVARALNNGFARYVSKGRPAKSQEIAPPMLSYYAVDAIGVADHVNLTPDQEIGFIRAMPHMARGNAGRFAGIGGGVDRTKEQVRGYYKK